MTRFKSNRRLFVVMALLMAFAIFGAACVPQDTGTPTEEDPDAQEGGRVIIGAEQEPSAGLNIVLVCCTFAWGLRISQSVLRGVYQVQPDFTYEPYMIEGEAEVTERPFTITYPIHPDAAWNDGTPVSADDFVFTVDTYNDPKNNVATHAGYQLITDSEVIDEKTVKFTFSEPYAAWKELFNSASPVLPKHAIEGENFNRVWNDGWVDRDGNPIGNGPFLFESYNEGADLTLVKNENYWGERLAYLDEIIFRFLPETNTEIQGLRGGEVDVIYPQPQLELIPLTTQEDLEVQVNAGTTWEHIDIQVGENGHPALKNDYVREALAYAIDRDALVSQLFKDLAPDLTPLHSTIYIQNQAEYEPNWEQYSADIDQATALLEDNGCTKGRDGIYGCDGERLSFEFTSTTGNALRELAFEVMQQQVRSAGIELKSAFGDVVVVFRPKVLVQGNYDLFMFAWVQTPDPAGSVEIWKCPVDEMQDGELVRVEGTQNFTGYCNEEVTELLEASHGALDPAERASLFNEADALIAQDIPTIPLYQKPTFLAYSVRLHGVVDNAGQEGFTWRTEDWWIEQ